MTRIVVNPEDDRVTTRRLRNEAITDQTVTFDSAGVSEQDLDDEVAEQFAEELDNVVLESEVDDAELDEVAQLLTGTVDEISEAIEGGAFDDRLNEISRREQQGDERTTVQEAVEQRRGVLESEDAE